MAKLFDLVEDRVEIKPESLLIYPFSEIWKRDKSKDKSKAYKEITYIWFYIDFDSPFFEYTEEQRHQTICEDVLGEKNFKIDSLLKNGIESYKKFSITPSMRMLESQYNTIYKMEEYFKNVDFAEDDIDKVTKAIINVPKLMEALNQAKEICKKEQQSGERVIGNKTKGMFEDE